MLSGLVALVAASLLSQAAASSTEQPAFEASILQCQTVPDCAPLVSARPSEAPSDEALEHLVDVFQDAGPEGRRTILDILRTAQTGRNRLATRIALHLTGYDREDTSTLIEQVQDDPHSSALVVLAHIGTPEALSGLIASQSGEYPTSTFQMAVEIAGDHIIPALLVAITERLENENTQEAFMLAQFRYWAPSASGHYSAFATPFTPASTRLLMDVVRTSEPGSTRRLAALMILQHDDADHLRPYESDLLDLARGDDAILVEPALSALMAFQNTDIVPDLAERCQIHELADDHYFQLSGSCAFDYFVWLGSNAQAAGPRLVELIASPHTEFRSAVIRTLAAIQYRPAIPALRARLNSEFWPETLTVARALQAFDDRASIPAIEALQETHWLPHVRDQLGDILADWDNTEDPTARTARASWDFPEGERCESGEWTWQGQRIPQGRTDAVQTPPDEGQFGERWELISGDYTLIGTDRGEWGGEVWLKAGDAEPILLVDDNVVTMRTLEDGAIITTGLDHIVSDSGSVYRFRVSEGGWSFTQLTSTPGPSYGGLAEIEPGIFAAFEARPRSNYPHHVSVFDIEEGMLGLAECVIADDAG